jgi:DNA modification methylase
MKLRPDVPERITGDLFSPEVQATISSYGLLDLTIADPPYGQVVNESWDKLTEWECIRQYVNLMRVLETLSAPGASAYVFGGIGKPGYRPFFQAISMIEDQTQWRMSTLITWAKKRAFGTKWGYLFTREEIGFFVLGDPRAPKTFNIPLLAEKRGYVGYSSKYPAKSEFKRRTNVWTDITEILRGKVGPCQKPNRLYEVMVETSSRPQDLVLDAFSGTGTLAKVCPDRFRILVDKAAA